MTSARTIAWGVSTDTLPDAFERYLLGMGQLYEVSGLSPEDRLRFFNRTRTTLTGMGLVGQGRSVRQTLARTSAVLRRSDVDGLNIAINRSAVVGDCDGRSVNAAPGAVQLRDLERLSASRLDTIDLDTVIVPRSLVPPALLGPDMHGLVLEPGSPAALLITAHMTSLQALAESLDDVMVETGVQALLLILTQATGAAAAHGDLELAAIQSTVQRAAGEYVERRLVRPGATILAGDIAQAVGVSRATLYRAFERNGGVASFVLDRRLHHARKTLRSRTDKTRGLADIAEQHGFASTAHFSRRFRATFGYSPSEVEPLTAPADLSMTAGPIRHDLLFDWLHSLEHRKG